MAVTAGEGGSLYFFHTNADYLCGLRLPMLKALVSSGYSVTAFAPDLGRRQRDVLAMHGIAGRRYDLDPAGFNPVRDLRNMWRLTRLLRREAPDIVFTNNIKPVVFGTLAAALAGIDRRYALVGGLGYAFIEDASGREARPRRAARLVASLLYAISFRLARQVIFHNQDDLGMLRGLRVCPKSKGAVVAGSGVDVRQFKPISRPPGARFVFVGRLLSDKGIREFLRAAEATKKAFEDATFTVVGGIDPNPASIREGEVKHYVERGIIHWTGTVSDVRPHLDSASVFVLPSYREGVPRSTLEAMASGLAVLTADSPGCRETVVTGVNGIVVPVRDADALAAAMMALCKDPALIESMGRASRKIAEERFSVELVNQDIVHQLEQY